MHAGDRDSLIERNVAFRAEIAADPLLSGWIETLQRGLTAKRRGHTAGQHSITFMPWAVIAFSLSPFRPNLKGPVDHIEDPSGLKMKMNLIHQVHPSYNPAAI